MEVAKVKESRIGVRLEPNLREQLEKLLNSGRFKSISEIVREALKKFFEGVETDSG